MSVKADATRENILNTAKKHFLQDGLDGASLRNIVKDAGLTTGAFYKYYPTKESLYDALVDPYLEHIYQIYDGILADFETMPAQEQTDHMTEASGDGINQIIDYVYDHYDHFRLLLKCGDSGKYAGFIHGMVAREIASTQTYMDTLRQSGIPVPQVEESLLHMINTGFFSSVFQIIEHDMDKETAKKNIAQLKEFQTGGWERLMNIKFPDGGSKDEGK